MYRWKTNMLPSSSYLSFLFPRGYYFELLSWLFWHLAPYHYNGMLMWMISWFFFFFDFNYYGQWGLALFHSPLSFFSFSLFSVPDVHLSPSSWESLLPFSWIASYCSFSSYPLPFFVLPLCCMLKGQCYPLFFFF